VSNKLDAQPDELAGEFGVPGVATGVILDGEAESYAFYGVTSVEGPLPVEDTTLFQFGSTGKAYTATAVTPQIGLDEVRVDLDAPARDSVPELTLQDADVADRVTALQVFNYTAGWDGDFFEDTGSGDDAMARYVERMPTIEQVSSAGATLSYDNASLSVAGRSASRSPTRRSSWRWAG